MTTFFLASTSNAFSSTLNGSIGSGDTSITVNSVTGLQSPGVLVIDRQDGSGNNTPTVREFISFTGISGNTLTGVTRGRGGSTAQLHNSGALIEETMTIDHWNDLITLIKAEHDSAGHHIISTATVINAIYASGASETISDTTILHTLNISGASVNGWFPLTPVWVFSGGFSGPTSHPATPAMPYPGNFSFANIITRTVASGASAVFDILKNGTSIFAGVTTPTIIGAGTFVSTASLNTKSFVVGDIFQTQIKTLSSPGVITDVTVELH